MRINTRARYSIRMMCDILSEGEDRPVPLKDIAKRQKLSRRYLEQLAIPLRQAGLLTGVAGAHGGYKIGKKPGSIKILDIIQAAEGPVQIHHCLGEKPKCTLVDTCLTRPVWHEINDNIIAVLASYTLEDLSRPKSGAKKKQKKK